MKGAETFGIVNPGSRQKADFCVKKRLLGNKKKKYFTTK